MKRPMRNDWTSGPPVDNFSMTLEEWQARHDPKYGGDPARRNEHQSPMGLRHAPNVTPGATPDVLSLVLAELEQVGPRVLQARLRDLSERHIA